MNAGLIRYGSPRPHVFAVLVAGGRRFRSHAARKLAVTLPSLLLLTTSVALAQLPNPFAGAVSSQLPATPQYGSSDRPAAQQQTDTDPNAARNPTANSTSPGTRDRVPNETTRRMQGNTVDERQLPPDRPTDFQRLVELSTGRPLPIFGSSLFREAPSTFAPVDNIPVTPDYVLGPGDELRLQLWGQVNQQGSYTIDRTGSIAIPQLGTVHVAGLHFADATSFLRAQFGRVFRNFDLNVNLGQLRSIQVFVVGQARQPGSYTIGSLSTLINALFASGGPLPQGSLRDIQVRRGAATIVHFDLYDLLLRGDKSKDIPLQSGDVIFMPFAGPQVAVTGSVNSPAIYELRGETRLEQILEAAGGRTSTAAGTAVRVERIVDHATRTVLEVSLPSSPDTTLENGDILTVNSIVDRFRNAVTLRGNVANPGRYRWHPGMRITDLLPDRDALVTRAYWLRRSELGYPAAEYLPAPAVVNSAQSSVQSGPQAAAQTDTANVPSSTTARNDTAQPSQPGALQSSTNTMRMSSSASGGGNAVAAAALAGTDSTFPPRNDVVLSAPDIDWSYAVVERQDSNDLRTTLLPFNLGAAVLTGDSTQNLAIEPNDVITIFSTADIRVPSTQQTRLVRLEGEFVSAGVYSVHPGETLRQLLARAGGFTPDAYLYASEFTRQSTRRVEQQRLNDYANQLEAQVSTITASTAARAITERDAAAAQDSASSARTAIARLRQLQPVGRIVLQLKPDSRGIDSMPDIALEDGDRFIVPKVPSSVYVEGEVYSANAFVFERNQHTARYLRLAGGPNREADRHRAFILRADGSVYSRQYGSVERALIFPGDAIIIPPVISKRAILRDLVDLSGIIGGFGVGVAAINVLK